jgi:hypothetical protein
MDIVNYFFRVATVTQPVILRAVSVYAFYSIVIALWSRTALGPTQPPIQWVPGALSLGVKRPRREADHSPPSSAEVKE